MNPRRRFILLLLVCAGVLNIQLYAQVRAPGRPGTPMGTRMPGRSISLTCSSNNSVLAANTATNEDAVNGIAYNGGAALAYKVYSDRPYEIRMSAITSGAAIQSFSRNVANLENFIFYRIISNSTGGSAVPSGEGEGVPLGSAETTIISNCPPTIGAVSGYESMEETREFSLTFRLRAGYSIPPGSYTTTLIVTATYE